MGPKKDVERTWALRIAKELISDFVSGPPYPLWDAIRPGKRQELMNTLIAKAREDQEDALADRLEANDKAMAKEILKQRLNTLRNTKPRNSLFSDCR